MQNWHYQLCVKPARKYSGRYALFPHRKSFEVKAPLPVREAALKQKRQSVVPMLSECNLKQ